MKTETLFSRNSDEWQTPVELFQDLDREFHFDLDACANSSNHMCDRYFTIQEDGLSQNWGAALCGVIHHTAILNSGYASATTKDISLTQQ